MSRIDGYFEKVKEILDEVLVYQKENIEKSAEEVARVLENEGMIFAFGTGHSHMLAEEVFYRAGGLVKVYPILKGPLMLHESASVSSRMERLPCYADILMDDLKDAKEGDVLFVFSNSGRNTVSIDIALMARKKGMKVICITNLKHARSDSSRHESGLMLHEVCDIVIDNCGVVGDACMDVGGIMTGPTSTIAGCCILNAIVCEAVDMMMEKGLKPEVWCSSNVDGGDEINDVYINKYRKDIKIL